MNTRNNCMMRTITIQLKGKGMSVSFPTLFLMKLFSCFPYLMMHTSRHTFMDTRTRAIKKFLRVQQIRNFYPQVFLMGLMRWKGLV